MERRVEQTDGHAIAVHNGHAVFEVIFRELIDGFEGFLGFGFVIAKQNFLNVGQTVAEEHVLCTEEANAAGAFVEGGLSLGGFRVRADVEGLDFLAPVEDRLSGFFEFAGDGHGDFAEVNFAGRTRNRDEITTFNGVAVAAEGTGGFVDRDFGGTDDGRNTPCGFCGYFAAVLFRLRLNTHGGRRYLATLDTRLTIFCAVGMMQILGSKAKPEGAASGP